MAIDATIETIEKVIKHPNADSLDIVTILGFQCIAPLGAYQAGDIVVYIRPDTVLPDAAWAEPFKKYAPKRVKPIRLRQEWSEGIVLPFDIYRNVLEEKGITSQEWHEIGQEVSELLEVIHYEAPAPQSLDARGNMPYYIVKTDEDRWENKIKKLPYGEKADITLKIDGSSCTFYYHIGDDCGGVTSRSLDIKLESYNVYTQAYNKYGIAEKLKAYCLQHGVSLALRGEVYGNSIQASKLNPHAKLPLGFAMYSVFYIDERRYAEKGDRFYYRNVAEELDIPIVPTLESDVEITLEKIQHYSTGIKKLDENYFGGGYFEGVVVKHSQGSFKIINKYYDSEK